MKVLQGISDEFGVAWSLITADAARWIVPEEKRDPSELTPVLLLSLLVRHQSLRATCLLRVGHLAHSLGVRGFPSLIQRRLLSTYGLEISPGTPIEGGLYIAHPVGCVLQAKSIGRNATIVGCVTLGTRDDGQWPTLLDDVFLGVGARVLGGIEIGSGARVGANAVVLMSISPGATAVGIPAVELPRKSSPTVSAEHMEHT